MEALQNEFEEACRGGDLRQAAEILRIAKYHLERHPEAVATIPVDALLTLLAESPDDDDGDFAAEIIGLINVALSVADTGSILSTHGTRLQAALQSNRPHIALFAVGLLQRALEPVYVGTGELPDEMLQAVGDLLGHRDTEVAEAVVQILVKSDVLAVREDVAEEMAHKDNVLAQTRLVRVLTYNQHVTNHTLWARLLQRLLHRDDEMSTIVALEEIYESLAASRSDDQRMARVIALDQHGLIEAIVAIADKLDILQSPAAVRALAAIFAPCHSFCDVLEARFRLAPRIAWMWNKGNVDLKPALYMLISNVLANPCVGGAWIDEMLGNAELFEPVFYASGKLNVAAMDLCTTLFLSPSSLRSRQEAAYSVLKSISPLHPVDHLIAGPTLSRLDDVKAAAYRLLNSILRHQWILNEAVLVTNLIPWLFNRQADPTLVGLHSKYELVEMLVRDWVDSQPDSDLQTRFREYLRQGVFYEPAAPLLATESRR